MLVPVEEVVTFFFIDHRLFKACKRLSLAELNFAAEPEASDGQRYRELEADFLAR